MATVCSGIGAPEHAAQSLGWETVWHSEIEPLPCAVLDHRFPGVPNLGDMTQIQPRKVLKQHGPIDILIGGTPCQSFSVAGLRQGLSDPRGNLALEFLRLVDGLRPRWFIWENVPGVLSSWSGPAPPSDLQSGQQWEGYEDSDFGCFLEAVRQLRYCCAYRILDAQHTGVAQRRRRVFVVGYSGDWRPPAAVLFERKGVQGDPSKGRKARQEIAGTVGGGSGTRGWPDDLDRCGALVRTAEGGRVSLTASQAKDGNNQMPLVAHTLRGKGHDASEDGTGRGSPLVAQTLTAHQMNSGGATAENNGGIVNPIMFNVRGRGEHGSVPEVHDADVATTLRGSHGGATQVRVAIPAAFAQNQRGEIRETQTPNLTTGGGKPGQGFAAVRQDSQVRRLTPIEWERLQGFPDDWTLVPLRGKPAADGPRYRAIGNSMAVPVMRWLLLRVALVDQHMEGNTCDT